MPPQPLRVAIVGSGPAGFYAAGALLASADPVVEVDLIDRLPTPWGLVRLGVAPDHPNIKAVSRVFEKIAQKPGFRFFGNVGVGSDITHAELAERYDAVIYACGAQADRRMGIPGEDVPGSWPATAFVAWYNGHPDFQDIAFDLDVERAVVIGNGNVAVDVARMLALTQEELAPTDTTDAAIEAITASRLREILVVGRRGPAQAAFTNPELVELTELDPASEALLEVDAMARRNVDVLREVASTPLAGRPRTVTLRFLASPVAINGDERVESIELVRNELVVDEHGATRAVPTDEREVIPCGIVFRSVGYQGVELPGVPFDERSATLPNDGGRVLAADGSPIAGLYCAGWIKRGPSGVIGTNKKDATETVELLLEDARAGRLPSGSHDDLEAYLGQRGIGHVLYEGWEAIDREERGLGEGQGRPRVKLTSWDELLQAARR